MNARIVVVALALSAWVAVPSAFAATTTRFLQAEEVVRPDSCVVNTEHAGFTGTGFANCNNDTRSFLEWTGVVPTAATRRLGFRYANGTTASRPVELRVGTTTIALDFVSTGSWATWAVLSVDVPLAAGDNLIRLRGTAAAGLPNVDRVDVSDLSGSMDWGVAMVESTLLRSPRPAQLGGWGYTTGLLLHGIYRTYLRTGDERYLSYIKRWVDSVVGADGKIYTSASQETVRSLSALDYILPGRAVLDVYRHFPQDNYRTALRTIRGRFATYPRTSDGGYWHANSKKGELWLDGLYMGQMFLSAYGELLGGADERYADDEGVKQITVQASHLRDSATGLYWHAWDEQGDASWPRASGTNHSQEFWCRAMGWYGMGMIEVLEVLATDHPGRARVIGLVKGLVEAWARYQDRASGRWFQVVNRGGDSRNWTETSCSSMYAYVIARAVEAGIVAPELRAVADQGYAGVLQRVAIVHDASRGADLTNISGISEGTNVGTADYYFGRARPVNDKHGLGAFLIMYEHFQLGAGR